MSSEQFVRAPIDGHGTDPQLSGNIPAAHRHRIRINKDLHAICDEGEVLLDCLESAGVAAQSGCRYGACGSCVARLLAGSVSYPAGVTPPRDPASVLLCVARPLTDLTLEVELWAEPPPPHPPIGGIVVKIIRLFNLRPNVDPQDDLRRARERDIPNVRSLEDFQKGASMFSEFTDDPVFMMAESIEA